jgi:hypothetical protein
MRIGAGISFLILFFTAIGSVWAFEANQNQKTVSGKIADVDRVGSMITVRYFNAAGAADEINIMVPDEAQIVNGTKIKSLCDINPLDPVRVTYYDDGLSGLKAINIADLNQPNR